MSSRSPSREHSLWWKTWLVLKVLQARLRFIAVLVAVGLVISYWSVLKAYYEKLTRPAAAPAVARADVEYFCPMHPQVVRDSPKEPCPICHMQLSRRRKEKQEPLPPGVVSRVQLAPYRVALAGVQTSVIDYRRLDKAIETLGSIEFDERKQYHVAARVKGRIDRLYANYTGQIVKSGEPLALVYSPDLVVTVQNLLDARRRGDAEVQAVNRDRLARWGIDRGQVDLLLALQDLADGDRQGSTTLTDRGKVELRGLDHGELIPILRDLLDAHRKGDKQRLADARLQLTVAGLGDGQVDDLLETGKLYTHLVVRSPVGGHVIRKYPVEGQYVDEGTPLYEVADLATVWLEAQVYEEDLAFLEAGQKVRARLPAFPGRVFEGKLAFVHPHLDEATRTLKVRIDLPNPEHDVRPGMYSRVTLLVPASDLAVLGTSVAEEVAYRAVGGLPARAWAGLAGVAPPAGLDLTLTTAGVRQALLDRGLVLAVPESAVIDTGEHKVVYREVHPGLFEGMAVQLGPRCGSYYPVLDGLTAGERVVTNGSFNIDADTRLNPAAGSIYFGGAK
jgi:Cu(I)/Ag(I) efflux system membrane fusion protein